MDRSQRDAGGVEHLGHIDAASGAPAGARWRLGPRDPIERVVWQTRGAIAVERALRAFWPICSLAAALWASLAFGFAEAAPRTLLLAGLGLGAAAALWLGWRGVSRFRWPTPGEARARVDADLPGRPLAALADAPALGRDDPGALGVWRAHMARMRLRAAAARAAPPDARLSREDPWALRLGALALVIAAILFARSDAISGLGAALAPSGAAAVATGPSFEAWAEPPAYTGKPTLYLTEVPSDPPLPVPEGSRVTLRVYGPPEGFTLTETVSGRETPALAEAAEGIAVASFDVTTNGTVSIAESGQTLGAWTFVVAPDAAPTIALAEPVDRAPTGEAQIAWQAGDDYGVATARAEIALDLGAVDRRYGLAVEPAPRDAIVVDLPLPMSGDPGEISGRSGRGLLQASLGWLARDADAERHGRRRPDRRQPAREPDPARPALLQSDSRGACRAAARPALERAERAACRSGAARCDLATRIAVPQQARLPVDPDRDPPA